MDSWTIDNVRGLFQPSCFPASMREPPSTGAVLAGAVPAKKPGSYLAMCDLNHMAGKEMAVVICVLK